jgi:hypothetical protein
MTDKCANFFCFVNLDPSTPKFFGFSEFLAGLALMILAWTIADTRYRFRIRTSPIPLEKITFGVIALVGVLTLLTDLWRAEGWPVLKGSFINSAEWQAVLAAMFFITFLAWVWFAFIRPSVFSRFTSKRYAQTIYSYIIRGDKGDLAIIADELTRSSRNLVKYASNIHGLIQDKNGATVIAKLKKVEMYADDILNLISDRRFCKAIVEKSPLFALWIFKDIEGSKKHRIGIDIFARNLFTEAVLNMDSFLYHESDYYDSGLIGHLKPLSTAMFTNFQLIENISLMFNIDYRIRRDWTVKQFEAYCKAFLLTVSAYINEINVERSYVINNTLGDISKEVSNLNKVNGVANSWDSDPVQRLGVCVNTFQCIVSELNKLRTPFYHLLRFKGDEVERYRNYSIYDAIADNMFEVIHHASYVSNPWWDCWSIQHNTVLNGFFKSHHLEGKGGDIIKHKLRRLIYNEIIGMGDYPNFKGARILAFTLNVLGLKLHEGKNERGTKALHKCVLSWVRKNYSLLYEKNSQVALACLVETITYDEKTNEIIKTYPENGLRKTPTIVSLGIDSI